MRVAVVSDVHGGLAALEAVVEDLTRQRPDVVLHGGDLVLSGPRPAEVIDRIRELEWAGVLGNTDELLWKPEEFEVQVSKAPGLEPLLEVLFHALAPATIELIGQERLEWLRSLPRTWSEEDLTVTHASPGDLWRAPMPDAEDDTFRDLYGAVGSRLVVYGHIHRPFVRMLSNLTVANSGSVGMPYDGDPRASYLLIDQGRVLIRRVLYDIDREASDLRRVGYPHADWLTEIRRRGEFVPPP